VEWRDNRMRPEATAFVHRGEFFQLKRSVVIDAEAATREQEAAHLWVARSWALVHPFASGRVVPSFGDPASRVLPLSLDLIRAVGYPARPPSRGHAFKERLSGFSSDSLVSSIVRAIVGI
jgi:hypothetical protein